MSVSNCATSSLAPYQPSVEQPWNRKRVQHLFRRLGFGLPPNRLEEALTFEPTILVDRLLNEAINLPTSEAPEWADWTISQYAEPSEYIQQNIAWAVQWTQDMMRNGFREKLALFWHNHFVTQLDVYRCPSWQYQYHRLLQEHSLGNFKTFLYEMGKTPAMLVYLNGVQNTRFEPNENYARELYELFSLGRDNGYTQEDIVETAKALTGWNELDEFCAPIGFRPYFHDNSQKTIFDRTGPWGYDEVHKLLFEERGELIAHYICGKLYRYFVSPTTDEAVVANLAQTFVESDFEIAPVLRRLFKSEHFFDDKVIGVVVKSPLDYLLNMVVELGFGILDNQATEYLLYTANNLGQRLFNPVDVAGWPGDRSWVDSNTLTARWLSGSNLVYSIYQNNPQAFVNLATALSDNSNDPYYITQVIIDHLMPNGLDNPAEYERATVVFKSEVPENYYEDGSWNLGWDIAAGQVALLLNYLTQQPDFQLM